MTFIEMIGFDPRKERSTVSYVCSHCGAHIDSDTIRCPQCNSVFHGKIWAPPKDIKKALEKASPMKVLYRNVENSPSCVGHTLCPSCHEVVIDGENFCHHCGQHLLWE